MGGAEGESELLRRHRQLASANRLGELALRGMPLRETLDEACRVVASVLGVELCNVLRVEADGRALRMVAGFGWRAGTVGVASVDLDATPAGLALLADVPAIIEDFPADPRFGGPNLLHEHGARSGVSVPIHGVGRAYGTIGAYAKSVRRFAADEVDFLQTIANTLGAAAQRAAAEEQLARRAEEVEAARRELAGALDGVTDAVIAIAPDGRIQFANAAAEDLLGEPGRSLVGLGGTELAGRIDLQDQSGRRLPASEVPSSVAFSGRPYRGILRLVAPRRGAPRDFDVFSTPVRAGDGTIRLAVNVLRDVTEELRSAVTDRLLADAGEALAGSRDLDATLEKVTHLIVPRFADWCGVWVKSRAEPVAVAHADPDAVELAREILRRWPNAPDDAQGLGAVLRTGEPELNPDIDDATLTRVARDPEHLAALRRLGLRSAILSPLRSRGEVLGALVLFQGPSRRRFDERDLHAATLLADRTAAAVATAAALEEAQAAGERLRVTLASIGDAVISTDIAGRVVFLNPGASALTGWSPEEAVGRPVSEVFHPESAATGRPLPNPAEAALRTGEPAKLGADAVLVDRAGTRRWVADGASPIRGADGRVGGVVLVFRDVTEARKVERELERASRLESLGVLAGGIAHDFNNLLTAITANLSLSERQLPAGHPVRGRIVAAEHAAGRATDLTRQLLTFAKGGAPVRAATSLPEILRDTTGFALQGAKSRAELRIAPDLRPISADAGQISQVVQNLVINANQAMPDGGRILVEADNVDLPDGDGAPLPRGPYVRLAVADEGTGIPSDVIGRVFDPFFTTKPGGSGLGLATVYSIVRKHDGHVSVESSPGHGARFVVLLPAALDVPAPGRAAEALPRGSGRVLVMDDEEAIRELLATCLRELGYQAEAVPGGMEAVARYRQALEAGRRFDAVLLDVTVPGGLGGPETLDALRRLDPEVRAIVSTGYVSESAVRGYRARGFVGVLPKPYRIDDLARVLDEVVGARARKEYPRRESNPRPLD